jgi:hypothetical protein
MASIEASTPEKSIGRHAYTRTKNQSSTAIGDFAGLFAAVAVRSGGAGSPNG